MLRSVKKILPSLIAVLFSFIIGAIVLLISSFNPIDAYWALLYGALGKLSYLGDTLARSTPVLFTGLAIALAFKCGMFNIGTEGQLLIGAMSAALIGHYLQGLPMFLHIPLTLIGAAFASALWGLIPGLLKAYKGIHEVIITIMMNYIATNLGGYLVESTRNGDLAETPAIQLTSYLPRLNKFFPFLGTSNVNMGFVLAVLTAVLFYFIIHKSVFGFEVSAIGLKVGAAENAGVSIKRKLVVVMLISAGLAGLGGAERVMGIHYSYLSGISAGFGFEGIAVALLANNNPIGIIFSAILFGALSSGGQYMNFSADVPVDIIGIIKGLIILFMAAEKAFVFIKRKRKLAGDSGI